MRERPVSRSHSVFREAKNCEAPWGLWFTGCSGTKENGQGAIPLVGKKKMPCKHSGGKHTDSIARRRRAKRGVFGKSPLLNSRKNFWATVAGMSGERTQSDVSAYSPRRKAAPGCRASAPKVTYQPIRPAARRRRDIGRTHSKLRAGLLAAPQGVSQKGKRRADVAHGICAGFALYGQIAVIADFP